MSSKIEPIRRNVVQLEPDRDRMTRARIARLPAPVEAVRVLCQRLFLAKLKQYFERADDSLFDLADKAGSNEEQNIYFDSMREVRVRRHSIETHFSEAIDQAFAGLIEAKNERPSDDVYDTLKADALSLVHDDDLEALVAVDSSVARANTEFGESIQYISLRLDSLVPVKVYQKNNPMGADVVCAAFMAEVKKLDVNIKAKLVLFRLFDKVVVSTLGDIYSQVNNILIDNNVMPSLPNGGDPSRSSRSSEQRRAKDAQLRGTGNDMHHPAPSYEHAIQAAENGVMQAEMTADMVSTLTRLFGEQVVNRANVQISPEQLAANQFVQVLNAAQRMPMQDGSVQTGDDIRSLVSRLRSRGMEQKLGGIEDQVMNLVNMLFDFILEDRNLAKAMKTLISRMQIPIIKVALADKTFFTKRGHVARKLLNEMSTAAMGWQGDGLSNEALEKDPLYKKMGSIVRTLLDDFETDTGIFNDLLADFASFLDKERKRVEVMERRTVDAEDGKAKASIARETVALELEIRTVEYAFPGELNKLIHEAWSSVLFVNALKYGYGSEEWQDTLATLDELIWTVQAPANAEQRQRLIKAVPQLLKKLHAGLDTISYNPFDMATLFKVLETVHLSCIRGESPVTRRVADAAKTPQTEPKVLEENVASTTDTPSPTPVQEVKRPLVKHTEPSSREDVVSASAKPVEQEAPASAPTPTRNSNEPDHASALVPAEDAKYLERVKTFSSGGWFDMSLDDGAMARCRLAAFIRPTGKYIFVNRNGMKVAERSQDDLVQLLKHERLRPLDDSMLFDRALETVVSGLRKSSRPDM